MRSSFAVDFDMGSLSFYTQLILKSAEIVSMSFIALFAELALTSSKAAIITSFFTQVNIGGFTMAHNMVFSSVLTVISFVFAILSVCNVENKDLM